MGVWVEKIYEGYYRGGMTPPDGDFRSGELFTAQALSEEFLKRGAQQSDIDSAFAIAEKHWVPIPQGRRN